MVLVATLWLALAIDRWLGEPPAGGHPVVWMGRYLGWMGDLVAPRAGAESTRDFLRFGAGALGWCAGALLVAGVACGVARAAFVLPAWAAALLLGIALKPLLAWRMLRDEVLAVEAALGRSLDDGRTQLARLVSRDVRMLSAVEVRESAIESLAENLNDSLVAPLFWFALLGLPGAAVYRFANTADAMWGYRGERGGRDWEWAGKWAARMDDVLSWIPARITAALLLLGSPVRFASCRREARRTPSPNGGWPMGAMALRAGVRLSKPGVYVLNAPGREAAASDMAHVVAIASRVVVLAAVCATVAMVFRLGVA
ncbi:adenosylcobinamide-phosphate synthase CbiB [Variovorax ureilyticus]|uniref:Cobalamin biosynthesis protein CobD n=1 Tax=Variovorax ureilyticus TaxID=1836198 RepID=A0ABU8VAF8_9BURK